MKEEKGVLDPLGPQAACACIPMALLTSPLMILARLALVER